MAHTRQNGAITVYLSIIMLMVLAVIGTTVDGARIRASETQVTRAAKSALTSTLAGYCTPLKVDYGIFALSENNPEQLQEVMKEYIGKNLMTELGVDKTKLDEKLYDYLKGVILEDKFKEANFANLFDYRIDEVATTPLYNLSENEVIRNQIVEFMKYRAPKEMLGEIAGKAGFLNQVQEVKKIGDTSKALNKKLELDEIMGKLGRLQSDLSNRAECINRFPSRGVDERADLSHIQYYDRASCSERASAYGSSAGNYLGILQEVREGADLGDMLTAADESRKENLSKLEKNLKFNRELNESSIPVVNKIEALKKQISGKLAEYQSYLNKEKDKLDKDFAGSFQEDIDIARTALEEDNAGELIEGFRKNSHKADDFIGDFDELDQHIDSYYTDAGQQEFFKKLKQITNNLNDLNRIRYDYMTQEEWKRRKGLPYKNGDESKDNRDSIKENKRQLDELNQDRKYNDLSEKYEMKSLPSFYEGGKYPNKIYSQLVQEEQSPPGGGEFGDEVGVENDSFTLGQSKGYNDDDLLSSKNLFGIVSGIGEKLAGNLTEMRDELYVNEYILGMFKNAVPQLKKHNADNSEKIVHDATYDLQQRKKGIERKAFFENCEAEYILFTKSKEKDNETFAKGSILAIRFAANTIYIHTDKEKVAEATAIAEAIAASLAIVTGGASAALIPAIREAILCAWAMAEAVEDVKYLMKGCFIPLTKNHETWISRISGGKGVDGVRSGENLPFAFSYHDYLRVFLIIKSIASNEDKMNRIEDLIQVNMQEAGHKNFKIAEYNTYIHAKTKVSTRYFFMTAPFMPKKLKTEDGRHAISTELYQGY